jgi:hypothetical protein
VRSRTNRIYLTLATLLVTLLLAACGGGGSDKDGSSGTKFPNSAETVKQGDPYPILANTELTVGPNRIAVGVIGPDSKPLVDAKVHFTFYNLKGGKETKTQDMDAVSRVPGRDAGLPAQETIRLPDGTTRQIFNVGEEVGIYTTNVTFPEAGDWGVEIAVKADNPKVDKTFRPRFNVIEKGTTPAIGSPAPKSKNLTADDVPNIAQIDSSSKPSRDMHTSTIAAAIAGGKPTLVLFAVPGFCESRLCGPELEIMRKLWPKYKDKVEFIHVEFYKDPGNPSRIPVEAVAEWGLRSEPWFFAIDNKGNVAAKYEGPVSLAELDEMVAGIAK